MAISFYNREHLGNVADLLTTFPSSKYKVGEIVDVTDSDALNQNVIAQYMFIFAKTETL